MGGYGALVKGWTIRTSDDAVGDESLLKIVCIFAMPVVMTRHYVSYLKMRRFDTAVHPSQRA
jgi:hypothetical protein